MLKEVDMRDDLNYYLYHHKLGPIIKDCITFKN